ncbi:FtsK/SpoIIIE family DNA translocase [Longimicrobium sp.]|uniref:FtsK/SpoIIIE family DNA translocase n=1 Tax=Longimicrobium sp. TaxID=2029185 RepID=UPI002BFDF443|nr:DNA translocase FtsK 4TM domain-containing protein [Longimicrobium sp.]HSU15563.1 DNA translocase FtsK 4TM domain-containing protein [Longimicrobium sp.]
MLFTLDDRQRRELWGLGLLALALLLALSLFPLDWFRAGARFPSHNVVGPVGGWLRATLVGGMGAGALAIPLLCGIWGLVAFDKLPTEPALRWSVLLGGLAFIAPAAVAILGGADPASPVTGATGAAIGGGMAGLMGGIGSTIVLATLFAALCVATVGWNPLRSAVQGGRFAWGHTRRAASAIPVPNLKLPLRRAGDGEEDDGDFEDGDEEDYRAPADDDDWMDVPLDDEPVGVAARAPALPAMDPDATIPSPGPLKPKRGKAVLAEQGDLLAEAGDPTSTDLPATVLLTAAPPRDEARNRAQLDQLGVVLVEKLATFKIEGRVVGMTTGPVVTQFEVEPAPGIKVARIANLEADLALALRAPSVRIVAPIPGKGAVGVEVPNPAPEMVFFREVIESQQFRTSKAALPLALGKDIGGRPLVADLARMPHLLIAGATGSGKSVCVNTIITSLIYRHTPQTLRFLMVDPKMVELSMYNDLPHLRHPVVTDNNDAAAVLKWAVIEMERRYQLLSANGVRNLNDFNQRVDSGQMMRSPEPDGEEGDPDRWIYRGGRLPYIVVIIDELADLMMTVQGEVEKPLALLAQKARAIGIHLILATQRPSVNVITGLIKANFPSRIAFRVSSKVDSRTILDQNGADALLGNGDMLMLPPASNEPVRVQGAFLSTDDTERLMDWYREARRLREEAAVAAGLAAADAREEDILEVVRAHEGDGEELEAGDDPADRDKLFREAAMLCVQHQGGSTSLLQRRLRIGYGRAARVIDQLHFAGVLGPPDGSKPRDVLVDIIGLDMIAPDD